MANLNLVTLQGYPTKDITVRYTENNDAVAKFTLAVNRVPKKNGEKTADFISCIAFGRTAEFIAKYFSPKSMLLLKGHIQTGSYTNKDNVKVYTTDIVADEAFFCQNANTIEHAEKQEAAAAPGAGFVNIPDSAEAEGLPWN